jgi:hypothetical protein
MSKGPVKFILATCLAREETSEIAMTEDQVPVQPVRADGRRRWWVVLAVLLAMVVAGVWWWRRGPDKEPPVADAPGSPADPRLSFATP